MDDDGDQVETVRSHRNGLWSRLTAPFDYDHNKIPKDPNFFTAGFMMEREDM